MLNKFFLLLFIPTLLFTQEESLPTNTVTTPPPQVNTEVVGEKISKSRYSLEYFSFKDLSTDTYWVSILSDNPQEIIDELNGKKDKKLRLQVGDIRTDIIKDSAILDSDNPNVVNFQISAYYKISSGKKIIALYSYFQNTTEILEASLPFTVPLLNDLPGKQPFIEIITPEGGTRGDTITFKGNNFGTDIDKISIIFYESKKDEKDDIIFVEVDEKRPFYLSQVVNETQELKFNIPLKKDLMNGVSFRKSLKLRMFVSGRPSNFVSLTLLPTEWKIYSGILGLILTILFLISLYWILRKLIKKEQEKEEKAKSGIKRPSIVIFFELILTDRVTNTYSLSKFQAFVWTIAAIGSYAYVIISQGLLLRNGKIPDFNPTLVVLMSISYGGLLAANGLGAKKPKNEVKAKPPQLSNLFCEAGSVDLSRLQLFGFTLVSIAAYIYNLALGNPLEGLPDIPPTLLGLMGVSQTGYLGNKAIGKETSINAIAPSNIEINQYDTPISILGSGFVKDTKVLLEGYSTPITTECKTPAELSFIFPKINNLEIGNRISITLLPPSGSPVVSNIYLEVVDIGHGGTTTTPSESESDPILDTAAKEELDAYREEDRA